MNSITCKAYGKVNLSLDVLGRRTDGYHLVRMVMQTVNICDCVMLERTQGSSIEVRIDTGDVPAGPDNLVWRAADRMRQRYKIKDGLRITLQKRIPVAAGMAGGSADAAAVFRGMREMYGLQETCSDADLQRLALPLGADIPYCITGGTQLAEGIGERLTPLPDAPSAGSRTLIVIKPALFVSTAWVYHAFDSIPQESILHPDVDAQVQAIRHHDLPAMAAACGNVLEQKTGAAYPIIGALEHFLKEQEALQTMMTGSGPTVFAIFDDSAKAASAYEKLEMNPDWRPLQKFLTEFA